MSSFRRRKHGLALGLTVAFAAVSLVVTSGCAASQNQNSGSSGKGASTEVDVAYSQPLNTLDPIRADQNQTNSIVSTLYDTLLTYNAKSDLVPSVATSYKLGADAKSISLTLRGDVKFHDGSTLTANDVKFTLDRDVKIGQGLASALSNYASSTVTDATHITINLKSPNADFPAWLTKFYILEQKLVTANAGSDEGQTWLQSHDAGSGPYQVQNGSVPVKVARYAKYWGFSSKRPESLVFRQIAGSPTKRDELKAGTLDIALTLQAADASALESANGVKVDYLKVPNAAYIFMNTATGQTANPQVRKALQLAYNYSAGLKQIRHGEGEIENGPLPQSMPCLVSTPPFAQNLAEAKSILQKAGINNLHLTLRFQPSISDQVQEATMFQSDLKKIGVQLKLEPIAFPDYLSSLSNVKTIPEMTLVQDTAPVPDPGIYLTQSYSSSTVGTTNRAGYSSPKVDALLKEADKTVDPAARCSIYKQVQTQINADAPAIFMYTLWAPVGYRSGLSGVVASQTVYPMNIAEVGQG